MPTAPRFDAFCGLVDPNDGKSAFLKGQRGPAVSIALLRRGTAVPGVVHAPLSLDSGPEIFAWPEGVDGILGNGRPVHNRHDSRSLAAGDIVLVELGALERPSINAELVAPARFIGLASLADHLTPVAVGDGITAVSLAHSVGWDYAAGQPPLRAVGGIRVNQESTGIAHMPDSESRCVRGFGGIGLGAGISREGVARSFECSAHCAVGGYAEMAAAAKGRIARPRRRLPSCAGGTGLARLSRRRSRARLDVAAAS